MEFRMYHLSIGSHISFFTDVYIFNKEENICLVYFFHITIDFDKAL